MTSSNGNISALLAFVREILRSPVNSPRKVQWRRALMFSLICAKMTGWVNNRKAGDLRRHRAHYDGTVMCMAFGAATKCQQLRWNLNCLTFIVLKPFSLKCIFQCSFFHSSSDRWHYSRKTKWLGFKQGNADKKTFLINSIKMMCNSNVDNM